MIKPIAISIAAAFALIPVTQAQMISPEATQIGVLTQSTSDLWWDPSQSGWGLQMNQQGSFVFATLYVYNQNNQATWYSANLTAQGQGAYTGPLYASTGPYFGAGTFDPSQVTRTQVGTMTVAIQPDGTAALTYSVNGVVVTKTVQREFLGNADLTGTFRVQSTVTATGCTNSANNGTVTGPSTITVTKSGLNTAQLVWVNPNNVTCTYNGVQTQSGSLAALTGTTYSCSTGETGTINFSNLSSANGLVSGRVSGGSNSLGCTYTGAFAGLNTQAQFTQ